jgi:1-acyl-sn-glycerol-3-phosphate acyltransferase
VLICAVLKKHQPRLMAKKELFDVPVLGWLVRQLGAYPIDRKGANADVILKTIKMLEDGYCVGMFPQGTRRAGVEPETTPVKGGAGLIASKSKASVLPIHIKTKDYRIKAFRRVKLIIGDPIPYDEYTKGGEIAGDARAITQYIFDRIVELGKEEEK